MYLLNLASLLCGLSLNILACEVSQVPFAICLGVTFWTLQSLLYIFADSSSDMLNNLFQASK